LQNQVAPVNAVKLSLYREFFAFQPVSALAPS
jgi:hypothetical protein